MTNIHPLRGSTIPITRGALEQRIRRKLAHDGVALRRKRSNLCAYGRGWDCVGDYYTIDLNSNGLIDEGFDLEELGRDLGVLRAYEHLEDDDSGVSPAPAVASGG